jgi:cytochrome b pre-mRNA-processing protein 3
MFQHSRRSAPELEAARGLYRSLMQRSREPVFYTSFAVPDTIDGRFDLAALHGFLLLRVLKEQGRAGAAVGEHLVTEIFAGFEQALRDLGVSDFGIPRRIKALANAFYGRLDAYTTAGRSQPELAAAIARNLYRGDAGRAGDASRLATYALAALALLDEAERSATLLTGGADFGPLPSA